MPSLPKLSTAGMAFLLSFLPLLFLLILGSADVLGASLREHRLRGSEPDPQRGTPYLPPNADMLKALEYIESLRQQTGASPQGHAPLAPDYDDTGMDASEQLRSMLRLASPAQSQSQAGRDQDEEEEEEEEEEGEGNEEEKTQEWLQAVLSTLEQSEKIPKSAPVRPNAARHPSMGKGPRAATEEEEESQAGGELYPSARKQRGGPPHGKYPPMFEDAEGGEGESDEEPRGSDRESPFKRTNENVEEKYTPQNLATLQSVFEELGRLANGKAGRKRQATAEDDEDDDDEDEDDDDDDADMLNPDYDDATGAEGWTPMGQIQTEEEERDNREEFDRGLEEEEEDDDEYDNDEDDEENYQVKRSTQPGPGEDPEDITKLVDYYLLKVLEKTEEEERKRALEEEEQRAERRADQSQYGDIDPQAIYQLIRISQKLQIPPEDLLDMLKTAETTKQDRPPQRNLVQAQTPNNLPRAEDKLTQMSSHKKNKSPPVKFYNRRLPETQTRGIPEDTEDLLNILGLGTVGNQRAVPLTQKQQKSSQSQFHAPAGRQGYTFSHAPGRDTHEDAVDEDELATYLTARMLTQSANNKAEQKRAPPSPSRDEQLGLGNFEQAIQDYFDQVDSDKTPLQKRQTDSEEVRGAAQTQPLDEEAVLRILSLLNPETGESEDEDRDAKTVKGM